MRVVSIIRVLGLVASLCVVGMGCSRASGSSESSSAHAAAQSAPNSSAAAAGAPARRSGRSACDLVTAEEASAILGESVVAKEISRDDASSFCSYAPGGDRSKEIQLKVQWTGGKMAWDANQTAVSLGGKLLGADRDGAAAGVMRAEEAKLGDKSSYNPILGAYVLKGDVLLEFNNLLVVGDARSKWEKLAATALARL
jgi:hypothetical protein